MSTCGWNWKSPSSGSGPETEEKSSTKDVGMVAVDVCKAENQGPELHITWGRNERPFFF